MCRLCNVCKTRRPSRTPLSIEMLRVPHKGGGLYARRSSSLSSYAYNPALAAESRQTPWGRIVLGIQSYLYIPSTTYIYINISKRNPLHYGFFLILHGICIIRIRWCWPTRRSSSTTVRQTARMSGNERLIRKVRYNKKTLW